MIRPIDTQILYSQSPELSNKQQMDTDKPAIQQDAFAHIMKDEVEIRKESVVETEKDEKVKNEEQPKEDKRKNKKKKKKEKKASHEQEAEKKEQPTKIDICL